MDYKEILRNKATQLRARFEEKDKDENTQK